MLALRVITAGVLVILSRSFTSQIQKEPTLREGHTVANVESQVITPNIPRLL